RNVNINLDINGNSQNGYGQNGYGQNGYYQNGYYQNGYGQNGYGQNGYGQNGYGQNGYGQNGYGQNGYNQNGNSQNGYDQNGYGQNGHGQNGYNQGYSNQGSYGQNGYGNGNSGNNKDINNIEASSTSIPLQYETIVSLGYATETVYSSVEITEVVEFTESVIRTSTAAVAYATPTSAAPQVNYVVAYPSAGYVSGSYNVVSSAVSVVENGAVQPANFQY
ncbi:hypothetical protein GGI22_007298, partial [Coemansia erecta]